MAIETTINLIQAINRTITGVTRAPDLADYPTVLDTPDLPCILTWTGDGQWHNKGFGGAPNMHDRIYRLLAFVEPLGQGDIPSRAVEAVDLLQQVIETYLNPQNVTLASPPVYQVYLIDRGDRPHTDTGINSILQMGGRSFHGFEVRLNVREIWTPSFLSLSTEILTTNVTLTDVFVNDGLQLCLIACRTTQASGTYPPFTYSWTCADSTQGAATTQTGAQAYFIVPVSAGSTTVTVVMTDSTGATTTTAQTVDVTAPTNALPTIIATTQSSAPNGEVQNAYTSDNGATWAYDLLEDSAAGAPNTYPLLAPISSQRNTYLVAINNNLQFYQNGAKIGTDIVGVTSGLPSAWQTASGTLIVTQNGINASGCAVWYSLDSGANWAQYSDTNLLLSSDVVVGFRDDAGVVQALTSSGKILSTPEDGSGDWTQTSDLLKPAHMWAKNNVDGRWWILYTDNTLASEDGLTTDVTAVPSTSRFVAIDAWENAYVLGAGSFAVFYTFGQLQTAVVDTGIGWDYLQNQTKRPAPIVAGGSFPIAFSIGYEPNPITGGYPATILFGQVALKIFEGAAGIRDYIRIGLVI